mmetsp:Transcript_14435/g.35229  ORF Transcript_14435/g.35229 Transcript_14435/m.35229 type:complete len:247 (-) Transcript_14435:176-916(-)
MSTTQRRRKVSSRIYRRCRVAPSACLLRSRSTRARAIRDRNGAPHDAQSRQAGGVRKVDLATGVCTAQPSLLCPQGHHICGCMAGRLPDGRIVCAGTTRMFSSDGESSEADEEEYHTMAGVLEPPPHGSPSGASWQWRALPEMGDAHRYGTVECVQSDGRFAVFGGQDTSGADTSSCEVLTLDADGARWSTLSPMHEPRCGFACVAIGGCVVVAGGGGLTSAEVYEEGLGRWRRLPCSLPHDGHTH